MASEYAQRSLRVLGRFCGVFRVSLAVVRDPLTARDIQKRSLARSGSLRPKAEAQEGRLLKRDFPSAPGPGWRLYIRYTYVYKTKTKTQAKTKTKTKTT